MYNLSKTIACVYRADGFVTLLVRRRTIAIWTTSVARGGMRCTFNFPGAYRLRSMGDSTEERVIIETIFLGQLVA